MATSVDRLLLSHINVGVFLFATKIIIHYHFQPDFCFDLEKEACITLEQYKSLIHSLLKRLKLANDLISQIIVIITLFGLCLTRG